MACSSPTWAWQSLHPDNAGKRKPVFKASLGDKYLPMIPVPCGKCINCYARKSMDWATRTYHEAQMHEQSCCFTLTYDNQHLPADGKLTTAHTRDFLKAIRKHFSPFPIRSIMFGEYGERSGRAHVHGFLFGTDALGGAIRISSSHEGPSQYENEIITRLWGRGSVRIDQVTPASCSYIAGYCLKKLAEDARIMSHPRLPALGRNWFDKNLNQLMRLGHVIIDGKQRPIPQIYFKWAGGLLDKWTEANVDYALKLQAEHTPAEIARRAVNQELNITSRARTHVRKSI